MKRPAATGPSSVPGDESPSGFLTEVRGLARGGGLNLVTMIFNQAVRLIITLIIGRILGGVAVGRFYQAFAIHELLALFAAAGFRIALTRFVAVHRSRSDDAGLKGVIRLGLGLPTAIAFVVGGLLALASPVLAEDVFGDPALTDLLLIVSATLPATVLTDVILAVTQGYGTMRVYSLVGFVLEPGLRLGLSIAAIAAGWGVTGAMGALLVTNVIATAVAWIWFRRLSGVIVARPRYRVRELLTFSGQTWGASMATYALIWTDTLLLGALDTSRSVGIYQVATRIVLLGAVFIIPLGNALAPRIARLYEEKRFEILKVTYRIITSWVLRLGVPFFIILLFFPEPVLRLFGSQFAIGATATSLLAIGGLFNAMTGPTDVVLSMCGRPGSVLVNNVTTLVLNVGLNIALIPAWGVDGAALAWTLSLVYMNVLFLIQIRHALGFHPFGKAFRKTAAAGVVVFAFAFVLDGLAPSLVGLAATLLGYVAVLVALGLDEDERLLIDALRAGRTKPSLG